MKPELAEAQKHVYHWVKNVLSIPSPYFNNFPPCPYSLNAIQKDKVDIRTGEGDEVIAMINDIGRTWDNSYEMIMVICDPQSITPDELIIGTETFNQEFKSEDLMSNFEHPANTNPRYKVTATNGKYALAIVQRLGNFVRAAKPLYESGYFKNVDPQILANYPSYQENFADKTDEAMTTQKRGKTLYGNP